jgi:hypothetical protein
MSARRRSLISINAVPTPREDLSMVLVVLVLAALGANAATTPPVPVPVVAEMVPVDMTLHQDAGGAWLNLDGVPLRLSELSAGAHVALSVPEGRALRHVMAMVDQLIAAGVSVRLDISRANAPARTESLQ